MQDENNARLIFKAMKAIKIDDPAIFVQWDPNGFNDTTIPNARNGIAGRVGKVGPSLVLVLRLASPI
ncbi:hypothetical protein RclHR1_13460005 [Rhizophagus clarus]|uniref:Uncharacterized protein n=1 Tax=Rhizophagus clarus TaxID=94130 RepID=A0A2Z6QPZ1_9GLOM|nr:hypothetical protein RclHR1_13460005 [Rhizophagus clarus]GES85998.1 hypothetical protein GLOIN_2v1520573 [Rhizophagus clarus]